MENFKYLTFIFLYFTNLNCVGTIIVLHGTGSSGKTSISNCLQQKLNDAVCVCIDDFFWPALIQNGINRNLIKKAMSKKEQQQIVIDHRATLSAGLKWFEILQELYQHAKKLAETHAYVILDTIFGTLKQRDFNYFCTETENIPVFSVLVYCSPLKIAEHVIQRNKAGNISENRDILSHIRYFYNIYKPTSNPDDAIDTINSESISQAFNMVHSYLLLTGMRKSKIQKGIQNLQTKFAEKIFIKNKKRVMIESIFPFDIMVNTGKISSQDCATLIYEKLMDH